MNTANKAMKKQNTNCGERIKAEHFKATEINYRQHLSTQSMRNCCQPDTSTRQIVLILGQMGWGLARASLLASRAYSTTKISLSAGGELTKWRVCASVRV